MSKDNTPREWTITFSIDHGHPDALQKTVQKEKIQVVEKCAYDQLQAENERFRTALEKIADPRKRDHREPDAQTELYCVMHIAEQALEGK
jgi:hypothetical protein